MNDYFPAIGILRTCFREKFGVPRQPLIVSEARGVLKLNPDPRFRDALNHLDGFSHVWIVFVFHKARNREWRPFIEPPKVKAPKRVGVFASRSPHRPNAIGFSAVKLDRIDLAAVGGIEIHVSGVDILDGSPVLDIKPYLPYADAIPQANAGWAAETIERHPVAFSTESLATLDSDPHLKALIEQMLEWDPRPTSQRRAAPLGDPESEGLKFAFRVLDVDVHWQIRNSSLYVHQIRTSPAVIS